MAIDKDFLNNDTCSFRINKALKIFLNKYSDENYLTFSKLINILILNSLPLISKNGTDIKIGKYSLTEYVAKYQESFFRQISGIERNTFLSKMLFINRVNKDIFKLIIIRNKFDKDLNGEKRKEEIRKYLELREKELNFYSDNEELKKEFSVYKDKILNGNGIEDIKRVIKTMEYQEKNILLEGKK